MRDIAISLVVIIGCFYTVKKPYIGVLLWSWLSYMNPHRMAYGFAYDMPYAQVTAIVLMASALFSKQKQGIPFNGITITWIGFILFMAITTVFAFYSEQALTQLIKVLKIQLIVILTLILITDKVKLNQLIWVITLSIGYFSVKGGIFTIQTAGGFRVWGPPDSFIEDNNGLAIAVLMIIPLMIYLRHISAQRWIRHGFTMAIILSLFTVLGSQSRGALLAIIAVAGFYWIKTKGKLVSGFILAILAVTLLLFMPESWYKRMDTINAYEEDASAMGRINAWEYAYNAANDNFLGMGFESWSYPTFALYAPNPLDVHAAHSIYFTVLADHGWLGLLLFLTIFIMTWRKLSTIIKKTSGIKSLNEFDLLARMLQISLIAYFVGGAFLSLSYFDLPWHMVSFVILVDQQVKKSLNDNREL